MKRNILQMYWLEMFGFSHIFQLVLLLPCNEKHELRITDSGHQYLQESVQSTKT
jgi:hypothetical protein